LKAGCASTMPDAVKLKRFLAALFVFNLGTFPSTNDNGPGIPTTTQPMDKNHPPDKIGKYYIRVIYIVALFISSGD
jgi:hypothetical protein